VITAVAVQPTLVSLSGGRIQLAVAYEFSFGDDASYAGESYWCPAFAARVLDANQQLKVGQPVTVRYRTGNPDISTLDPSLWQDF